MTKVARNAVANAAKRIILNFGLGVVLGATLIAGQAAPASAATRPPVGTRLELKAESTTVSGRPVKIDATLVDEDGDPVFGALIRLVTPADFLGSSADEILTEATTGPTGAATMYFAPVEAGQAKVTARVVETRLYGPAEAALTFQVKEPVPGYHKAPVGVGGRWARSYLVLVPLAGVWFTYLMVVGQMRKIRRATRRVGTA